jgi:predicted transcriptional regulator
MVEFTLELFANDTFKLLKSLKENQVEVKGIYYIPLSQQEIADINKMSKLKTNRLLRDLIEGGFVCLYQNKRGKYEITEKGHKVLRLIQKKNI